MKNIFLIGRFNRITQDFNDCLSGAYHVQLGSDNSDIIRGMLAMNRPDLVVINLMSMDITHEAIFRNITEQYPGLPVICVGNQEEVKRFEPLMKGAQYIKVVRPIGNPELLKVVDTVFSRQKKESDHAAQKAEEFVQQGDRKTEQKSVTASAKSTAPRSAAKSASRPGTGADTSDDLDDYETLKAKIEAMLDGTEEPEPVKKSKPVPTAAPRRQESKPEPSPEIKPEPKPEPQPEPEPAKPQILLVDDNAIQIRSLKGALQKHYDVAMATSGREAIRMIERRLPDLVFLDYEMPECDGRMTLKMIRDIPEAVDLPVVFLTGVKNKENIKAVLELKPAGYMLKPANQDMIMSTIEKILGEKK